MGKDQELLEAARNGNTPIVEKILSQRAKRSGPLARWVHPRAPGGGRRPRPDTSRLSLPTPPADSSASARPPASRPPHSLLPPGCSPRRAQNQTI